jgi:hypothetical protein
VRFLRNLNEFSEQFFVGESITSCISIVRPLRPIP